MTTDIDVNDHNHNHNGDEVRESEEVAVVVSNNDGEQCCGSDVVDLLPKIHCNKDDVGGSYVFVSGHDDGDDLADPDLSKQGLVVSQCLVEEKKNDNPDAEASGSPVSELNSRSSQLVDDVQVQEGGGGGEEISESGVVLKNSVELGLAEGMEKDQKSDIAVEKDSNSSSNNVDTDNTDQDVKKAEETLNETPSGDDLDQAAPSRVESEIKLDMVVKEIPVLDLTAVQEKDENGSLDNVQSVTSSGEIGDSLPDVHGKDDASSPSVEHVCENQAEQNESSENAESLPSIAEGDQQCSPRAHDGKKPLCFSKQVPVEGSKEHSSETTSTSEVGRTLETEVASGPLLQQNGESLPADFAHESRLETTVVTERNGSPTTLNNEKPLSFSDVPVEGFKGNDGEVFEEHRLETSSSSGVDKTIETEVSHGPVLEQNGEDLPAGLAPESLSETTVVTEQKDSPSAFNNVKQLSVSEEVPVKGSKQNDGKVLEEHGLETSSSSGVDKALETEVSIGPLLEQNGDDLPDGLAQECLSRSTVVTEQNDSPTALDNEKKSSFSKEVPVEGSEGNDGKILEDHGLETCPGSGVDKSVEAEVANGPLLEQNGEHLPDGLSQETLSETVLVMEQDVSSKNAESLTIPSVCGDVALESGQSMPTVESGQSMPAVPVNDMIGSQDVEDVRPEIDTGELTQESIKNPNDSCPALKNGPESSCPDNSVISEPECCSASNGGEERVSTDAIDVESMISNTGHECVVNQHVSNATNGIAPPKDSDSGIVADGDLDFEHIGSDVKSACQEAEGIAGKKMDEASSFFQESSGHSVDIDGNQKDEEVALKTLSEDKLEGQNAGVEVVKRPFYYLIRIPRYDDENLREQIKHVELQVEERTRIRDAIVDKVHVQTATAKDFAGKVQASFTEERAARELFKSKRQEIDSVQFLINKVKNAQSVEDIHAKIRSMEHMIEHETLPLKEEKQLIRDIKQLKQLREQLSSNMGKQDEVQQALDQKDQMEERLKVLRKELDLLREKITKAEEVRQIAKEKSNVENDKLKELVSQFRDADKIRQEAYAQLRSLKKQRYEKNNHFYRYKDALEAAQKLALSGDKEQLQRLCIDQVDEVVDLWNRNDDFRQDYIKCNTRSTLRRLTTLDGRSLGPDEEAPVIPDVVVKKRATKDNSVSMTKIPEQEKQEVPAKADKPDDKSGSKVVEKSKQPAKNKKPAKLASSSGTKPVTVSGEDERKEEVTEEEDPRRNKEEEELARKAEELRKEEEAVKLKQQRNLEEKAKAKEAMERKKRIAEKAQARAAIRAQKEAEEKEKEREKRARKKEKKKATGIETGNGDEVGESAPTPSSEIPGNGAQPASEKPATIVKRPQKAQQFSKQSRTRSVGVPPPFRNRGKRRMQPWMLVALVGAIVLALFLCWSSCMQWFGF